MTSNLTACGNQVFRYFRYLDERDYDALTSLLTHDAVWHRQGRILTGRAQVHEALRLRSGTMRIAHIITNLMADTLHESECAMRAYMLVVRHEPGHELVGPAPLQGIESIRTMHIKLKRDGDEWLISEMTGDGVLFAQDAQEKKQ